MSLDDDETSAERAVRLAEQDKRETNNWLAREAIQRAADRERAVKRAADLAKYKPMPFFDRIPEGATTIGFKGESPSMNGGGSISHFKSRSPDTNIILVRPAGSDTVTVYGVLSNGDTLNRRDVEGVKRQAAWQFKGATLVFPEADALSIAQRAEAGRPPRQGISSAQPVAIPV